MIAIVKNEYTLNKNDLDHLDKLEAESIYIFREAIYHIQILGMLWSFGKDSNVMCWLAMKAFYGKVPFPLIQLDTELEMQEVYDFRDKYKVDWNINLIQEICPPYESTDASLPHSARIAARKTGGLKQVLDREKFDGIIAGIRRDEEGTRAKERYFSPRGVDNEYDRFRPRHAGAHPPPAPLDRAGCMALHKTRGPADSAPIFCQTIWRILRRRLQRRHDALPQLRRKRNHLPTAKQRHDD